MPPMAAITGGITVIVLCFLLRIPIFLIGLLSVILLIYTILVHKTIFELEYKTMSAPAFFKQNASIFIILAVIIISLAYILYLFGPNAAIKNQSISRSSGASKSDISKFLNSLNPFGSRQESGDRRRNFERQLNEDT